MSFSSLRVMGEYDIYHVWYMTAISTRDVLLGLYF